MRKPFLFMLLLGAMLTFSSSRPVEKSLTAFSGKIPSFTYYWATTLVTSFQVDGCTVTIEQPLVFVFSDDFQLIDIVGNSKRWHVTIDCGSGGVGYARSSSEVEFVVNDGKLDDVVFQQTGESRIDQLYANHDFKTAYLQAVKDIQPHP